MRASCARCGSSKAGNEYKSHRLCAACVDALGQAQLAASRAGEPFGLTAFLQGGRVDPAPKVLPTVGASSPADAETAALMSSRDWFVVVRSSTGQRSYGKDEFVERLRTGILDGSLRATDQVETHAKGADGKWTQTTAPLTQFAKAHFGLRVLYEPVWAYAMEGLKWGIIICIGLKLLDSFILCAAADPSLGFLFLVAVGLLFIPRVGIVGMVIVSIVLARFTSVNVFGVVFVAALVGAALGCLPGMAVGGIIGLSRRRGLPLARDAAPQARGLVPRTVVLPSLGAVGLWSVYLFVFNPWLVGVLSNE